MVVSGQFPEVEINNEDESDALSVLKCVIDGVS